MLQRVGVEELVLKWERWLRGFSNWATIPCESLPGLSPRRTVVTYEVGIKQFMCTVTMYSGLGLAPDTEMYISPFGWWVKMQMHGLGSGVSCDVGD